MMPDRYDPEKELEKKVKKFDETVIHYLFAITSSIVTALVTAKMLILFKG